MKSCDLVSWELCRPLPLMKGPENVSCSCQNEFVRLIWDTSCFLFCSCKESCDFAALCALSLLSVKSSDNPCLFLLQFYISVTAMACLSVMSVALNPPSHLPDLFPVLVSMFAFTHFLGTFLYFNIVQFSAPPSRKSQKKKNWIG